MRTITRSIDIGASARAVYEFITEPANLPQVWPSLVAVSNVERAADGWHSFDWIYKMGGMQLRGHARTVRAERDAFVEVDNDHGVPSHFRWRCEPRGAGTRVVLEVQYVVPAMVIGRLAEPIVAKMNEREMELLLANIKTAIERAPSARPEPRTRRASASS